MDMVWKIKDSKNQVLFSSNSYNEVMGYYQEMQFDIDSFGKYLDNSCDDNFYIDFEVVNF